ncbi:heme exporter protein CcmD [Legionella sp. CNM-4043-24]|uniref:heme exporter protein CcmD n=1 Tax=Legionella sp. CNM-4043-24 TaxID=3421646 RepID=UPI00403B0C97
MNQFSAWLSMGGYSAYIWPTYALVCVVLLLNLCGIRRQRRKTLRQLRQWVQANERVRGTDQR